MSQAKPGNPLLRLLTGFGGFFRGFAFIHRHKLWSFVILPSLISLGLGLGLFLGMYTEISQLVLHLWSGATGVWAEVYETVIRVVAAIVALFITLFSYQFLASLLVIPFLGPLLAQVEQRVTGKATEVSPLQDFKNALMGIWIGVRDLGLQLMALVVSLFMGPLQPLFLATVTAHFLGRGSFDFLLEKHSRSLGDRYARTRTLLPEIQGLGFAQFLVLFIPVLGILIAPASALVGATLVFYGRTTPIQPPLATSEAKILPGPEDDSPI